MLRVGFTRLSTSNRYFCTAPSLLNGSPFITSKSEKFTREEFFKDKTVVIFGVPGAFTPVCSEKHVCFKKHLYIFTFY